MIILAVAAAEGGVYFCLRSSSDGPQKLSPQQAALSELFIAKRHDPPDTVHKAYESYLAQFPNDASTRIECAEWYEKKINHPSAALGHYQILLRDNPRDLKAHLGAARCHEALGQRDLAVLVYEQAARLSPEDAAVHKHLGMAHYRAGNAMCAMDALQKSLTLDPNQNDLVSLISRIAQGGANANEPGPFPGATRRRPDAEWNPAAMPDGAQRVPGPAVPRPVDPMRYGLGREAVAR